jgi:thymidylate synthase
MYRNATHAFVKELASTLIHGEVVNVRGNVTQEITARTIQIERPRERHITLPARRNDPFATIAETMWVLGGRNDLAYLSRYLPRAGEFSDDGSTWRAGYGPRVRNWHGVDQLAEVYKILRDDPRSRRAVISIFDPASDFVVSKDVPCNNWLHFLVRNGRLDMSVAIRSNDLIWGFSGINTFEWSVLQELLASWLQVDVGTATFFADSLHLYERHHNRAKQIVSCFVGDSGYESGWAAHLRSTTPFESFRAVTEDWFRLERRISTHPEGAEDEIRAFPDPLLGGYLFALLMRARHKAGAGVDELESMLATLGHSDLALAVGLHTLGEEWYRGALHADPSGPAGVTDKGIRQTIVRLHRSKSETYGDSWKRRGEQMSIIPNIARKVDRIQNIAMGLHGAMDESLTDTVFDLLVYGVKYLTFLVDLDPRLAADLEVNAQGVPFSDGTDGFEQLLERVVQFDERSRCTSIEEAASAIVSTFDRLVSLVDQGGGVEDRFAAGRQLVRDTSGAVCALAVSRPLELRRYVGR